MDEFLDLLGGLRAASCELTNLARHNRKPSALIASASRFNCRVQCQEVGLKGNLVDNADDVFDLATGIVDLLHRINRFTNHLLAGAGARASFAGQRVGALC